MNTVEDIKDEVEQLAVVINAPERLLPTYGTSIDNGHPHVEVHGETYHYIILERGQELDHRVTFDLQELLYWIFQDITFSMASSYELSHRDPQRDHRRLLFSHQLDLLGKLDAAWQERYAQEITQILRSHPFSDLH